jgi:thiosulfate reductase cytochrome b subunit
MTSFASVDYPTEHPGVVRLQRAAAAVRSLAGGFDSARGAATLLLAAIVAALVVVANEVVETWTEGHLLAAWVVMWTLVFAAIGLFAKPARRATRSLQGLLKRVAASYRQSVEDEKLWQAALSDARVMADISRATGVPYGNGTGRPYY